MTLDILVFPEDADGVWKNLSNGHATVARGESAEATQKHTLGSQASVVWQVMQYEAGRARDKVACTSRVFPRHLRQALDSEIRHVLEKKTWYQRRRRTPAGQPDLEAGRPTLHEKSERNMMMDHPGRTSTLAEHSKDLDQHLESLFVGHYVRYIADFTMCRPSV